MITKTNYFKDFYSALCHYRPYMYTNNNKVVQSKIDSGEIVIGKPQLIKGDVLILNDGQYSIATK